MLTLGVAAATCPVVLEAREAGRDNSALTAIAMLFTRLGIFVGQMEGRR